MANGRLKACRTAEDKQDDGSGDENGCLAMESEVVVVRKKL
jgi:hypothetical protein